MSDVLRNIGEIAFGVLFLVGAIFNLAYTLSHGEEFFGSFAANAWLRPSQTLVRRLVIPRAKVFTVLLVALQLSVAVMIFSRGELVTTGLTVGAAFALAAAFVSSPGGAVANLALAAAQALLALAR
jgi:hypothetical protein